jgi:hypothetical protein
MDLLANRSHLAVLSRQDKALICCRFNDSGDGVPSEKLRQSFVDANHWPTENGLRAAETLTALALELEAKTARDIWAVARFDSKSDLIAFELACDGR